MRTSGTSSPTTMIEHIKKHGDPWNLDKELPPMTDKRRKLD
jgi:hypothetical protein